MSRTSKKIIVIEARLFGDIEIKSYRIFLLCGAKKVVLTIFFNPKILIFMKSNWSQDLLKI